MISEYLERLLAEEKVSARLQKLPYHYMELSQLILSNFKDEFQEPDKLLAVLQDVENIRMDRLRVGALDTFFRSSFAFLDHILFACI